MSAVGEDLARVVKMMVDQPERVQVEEVSRGQSVLLQLRVAPEDLGKVIGRQGRTVRALRSLLEARAARSGVEFGLEILE